MAATVATARNAIAAHSQAFRSFEALESRYYYYYY
jgi:hypothetical protein